MLGKQDQFFNRLTFLPTRRLVAKNKVISGVQWLLEMPPPVAIRKLNGRGLIPELYHLIIVLSFEQKGKFHLGTLSLHDALHFLGWIPVSTPA